jgi:nicotinic acid mononucleotide adenylyltransferase
MASETLPRKIGIFGTSVNPPTNGHIAIVNFFANQNIFDEIWVHPVYEHMFSSKRSLQSFEHRMNLSHLAFDRISNSLCKVRVMTTEKDLNEIVEKSSTPYRVGTIDILEYLRGKEKSSEFSLILGADTYRDLISGRWKRWKE